MKFQWKAFGKSVAGGLGIYLFLLLGSALSAACCLVLVSLLSASFFDWFTGVLISFADSDNSYVYLMAYNVLVLCAAGYLTAATAAGKGKFLPAATFGILSFLPFNSPGNTIKTICSRGNC
jgi:hypothetical protein